MSAALGWRLHFHPEEPQAPHCDASVWSTPITDGQETIGRLSLTAPELPTQAVAHQFAIATSNAVAEMLSRLAAAERKLATRTREVSTLVELGRTIPRTEQLSVTLRRLLQGAVELTGLWSGAFFLVDPAQQALRLRVAHNLDLRTVPHVQRSLMMASPDAVALLEGEVRLTRDDPALATWLPTGSHFGVGVPVRTADGPLGVLWCYERRRGVIAERQIHILQTVAAQIAGVLERTVLLKDSEARHRLRHELQAASRHHGQTRTTNLPQNNGLEVALRSASASELTGDLCEVWPISTQRTLVALGDAVGHSVPAALVMAVARGALRTLLQDVVGDKKEPAIVVPRINRTLCSVSDSEQFMTLVCGTYDHRAKTFTYVNAGHLPPWLLRGEDRRPLHSHGLLCGVLPETSYSQEVLTLQPDDVLVFFTDGVTEAMSPQRQLFRTEGLLAALGDRCWTSAADVADAIWTRLMQHAGAGGPTDDQTLLVLRVKR